MGSGPQATGAPPSHPNDDWVLVLERNLSPQLTVNPASGRLSITNSTLTITLDDPDGQSDLVFFASMPVRPERATGLHSSCRHWIRLSRPLWTRKADSSSPGRVSERASSRSVHSNSGCKRSIALGISPRSFDRISSGGGYRSGSACGAVTFNSKTSETLIGFAKGSVVSYPVIHSQQRPSACFDM